MSEGTLFRVFFEKAFFAFSWTKKETKKIQKGLNDATIEAASFDR